MRFTEAAIEVACQLLFCERGDGEILVDLLALEPVPVDGEVLAAGTPLTLGLADPSDGTASETLVGLLDTWTEQSSVCHLRAVATPLGKRLCLSTGDDRLVIDIAG
jgi:hypothetical protein